MNLSLEEHLEETAKKGQKKRNILGTELDCVSSGDDFPSQINVGKCARAICVQFS